LLPESLRGMKPPDDIRTGKEDPPSKPTRPSEALRIIEEYAKSLREIIKKLRGKLN
jgi:hypothetical protein